MTWNQLLIIVTAFLFINIQQSHGKSVQVPELLDTISETEVPWNKSDPNPDLVHPSPTGPSSLEARRHGLQENSSGSFNQVIVNEICEDIVNTNLTRKERLLCLLLKLETKAHDLPDLPDLHKNAKNETEEAYNFLPKDYNKLAAPSISTIQKFHNGSSLKVQKPVTLYTYLNIRSVRDMDEDKEEVTLDMDMIILWVDGHILNTLRKRNVTVDKDELVEDSLRPITPGLADKIWMPDLFFQEVVQVKRPVVLDKGMTVLFNPRTGAILLRSRFFVTLLCNMDFFYYPADSQRCPFHIRSGVHTSEEVNIDWWRNKGYGLYLHETSNPNFDVRVASISKFDRPVNLGPETRQGRNSSYLKFEIHIRRKMSYHLLQTYLPSVFFIIVTWLCFLIPSRMLEARIGVTMTTLLTLTSMFSSIRENTQVVSYVKAIDIWMVTCIFFIFVVLFAFTWEAWIRAARKRLQAQKDESNRREYMKSKSTRLKALQAYSAVEGYIERFSAGALFASFLLFNIGYWSWLLISSEHITWHVNPMYNDI